MLYNVEIASCWHISCERETTRKVSYFVEEMYLFEIFALISHEPEWRATGTTDAAVWYAYG